MRKFNSLPNQNTNGVPAEPCAPPESLARVNFSGPLPSGLVGDFPTISISQLFVKSIQPYSKNTQKEALREMINRLQRECNHG